MLEDLNARIEETKQRLAVRDELQRSLPQQHEQLDQEGFHRRRLEVVLDQIGRDIQELESLSLGGLWASVLGQKQQKLDAKQEEASEIQSEFDQCLETLSAMENEINEAEHQLAELGDAEADYRALCDEKQSLILDRADDGAERLAQLSSDVQRAEHEQRAIAKAIQVGEHLAERLETMVRAVRRAKKAQGSYAAGVLAGLASQMLAKQGIKGSVNRVFDGFDEFRRLVREVDLSGDSGTDQEIMQLIAEVDQFESQMNGGATYDSDATLAMHEGIKDLIAHLEEKADDLQKHVREIDAERLRFIEQE